MRPDWSLVEFFYRMPAALLQVGVLRQPFAATWSMFECQHSPDPLQGVFSPSITAVDRHRPLVATASGSSCGGSMRCVGDEGIAWRWKSKERAAEPMDSTRALLGVSQRSPLALSNSLFTDNPRLLSSR
jgi:hypothetical protein